MRPGTQVHYEESTRWSHRRQSARAGQRRQGARAGRRHEADFGIKPSGASLPPKGSSRGRHNRGGAQPSTSPTSARAARCRRAWKAAGRLQQVVWKRRPTNCRRGASVRWAAETAVARERLLWREAGGSVSRAKELRSDVVVFHKLTAPAAAAPRICPPESAAALAVRGSGPCVSEQACLGQPARGTRGSECETRKICA